MLPKSASLRLRVNYCKIQKDAFYVMIPSFAFLTIFLLSDANADAAFNSSMKILHDKAAQCDVSIKTSGPDGRFCQDFKDYQEYLFKGDTKAFIQFLLDNGDINSKNDKLVKGALNTSLKTLNDLVAPGSGD